MHSYRTAFGLGRVGSCPSKNSWVRTDWVGSLDIGLGRVESRNLDLCTSLCIFRPVWGRINNWHRRF